MNTKKTAKRVTSVSYDEVFLKYLADPATASAYLKISMEDEDPRIFLTALARVAKANGGVAMLAKKTGLNRENLYRTLSPKGNPKLESIDAMLRSLGMRLSVELISKPKRRRTAA